MEIDLNFRLQCPFHKQKCFVESNCLQMQLENAVQHLVLRIFMPYTLLLVHCVSILYQTLFTLECLLSTIHLINNLCEFAVCVQVLNVCVAIFHCM